MVNLHPSGHDELALVRERALASTDLAMLMAEVGPGTPVVWANAAFERLTGWAAQDVVGRSPSLLQGPGTDPEVAAGMSRTVARRSRETVTVLNYRKDGTPFWNRVTLSPVTDASGEVTHYLGVQVDVTDEVERLEELRRSVEEERRARHGLTVAAQTSELLSDLEDPYLLREICSLLRQELVEWAGFFLDDDGLRFAEGLTVERGASPSARGHGPAPAAPAGEDAQVDLVYGLLAGTVDGPVELALREEPTGRVTAWLAEQVRQAIGRRTPPPFAVVQAVPGRRRTVGLLVTVPRDGAGLAGLTEHDRIVLNLVVRRVGIVTDNVRLYAREHLLAETLQRAMLPEQAEVPGLDVWTYYAPSAGHAQVGGDWYDVLPVGDDHVAVVIGDVVGHDVEAAAAMGQLRSVVRAYAFETADPAEVLRRVDQLVAGMRVPRSASLVLVTMVRDGEGWQARYARAGHLPPLLAADGEVHQLTQARGPLIGFGGGARGAESFRLDPGGLLVLYTDGLIERRDRRLRDGLQSLVDTVGSLEQQDAAGVGEQLLSRLAADPEDDVAVVVVRVPDPTGDRPFGASGPRRRRWSLPGEPASIGRARQAVVRTCEAWGIDGGSSAELVVSELVGNAVLHGRGDVVLRLFDTGEGLRIEVEDANPAPPVTTDGHPGRVGGFGMQIVERLSDWGWRPSGSGKLVWARVHPVPIPEAFRRGGQ
jgi:PAS domain S-box-containing protein